MKLKSFYWLMDGLLFIVGLVAVNIFITLPSSADFELQHYFYIAIAFGLILSLLHAVFLSKMENNKDIVKHKIKCILFSVITLILVFVLSVAIPERIFPVRLLNNADGLILLFANQCYVLVSVFSRVTISIVLVVKNMLRDKTGDGSMSRS